MEIKQGFSYHIKDEFFLIVSDKYLMSNKEDGSYRPHYYAIQDEKNKNLLWMIPISSKVEKYREIRKNKLKRNKKCSTIVIGKFAGRENVFLIQNAFPITVEYIDHIHTIQGNPVALHENLRKELKKKLKETLVLKNKGINLFFVDIDKVMSLIVPETCQQLTRLEEKACQDKGMPDE